ncbi:elongation factor P maturation arginine rhamnosyltransferase EarP [Rhodoferax sp.]|uniref:elongation factor P maturation arginine rhamnosyltransferase EarP n=1 Tax=Rhodoferax sp. TaxID=50421 RepID=UPI00272F0BEF|nr:elongation factor P maturation arginine rhamnosyltransferase EarP [Rhodoferax sp.]MDP1531840.1 elongation factor P maturation arginine rhamnosyltransferase EarP [Rhodoferax sp.]MDP1944396.1 elongation factor P maturation arginine rhamnosyltransferase EarP [Rhodoferax sp.]MDP2443359.1 elongation factor P maturation arginine rhamnosyltransferase EarP [Rhodoferax sp.]MDZ4209146.1 elongation factor P maturation arginine rhamnosyltransferase EarP [Rhodoferax sp.]
MPCETPHPTPHWDIFCRVIDNFGDLGVCWRLACDLAGRGQVVRLWADDVSALAWMAPQGAPGVEVKVWTTPLDMTDIKPGEVMLEAFGCTIDEAFVAEYARKIRDKGQKCAWINLEYLSAEDFSARCHGLPSPVMSGSGRGLTKHFFYPGFTTGTGGLLREPDLLARQARFDRQAWLDDLGLPWQGERLVSLFCYEPAGLDALLLSLASGAQPSCLLVTPGRASAAVRAELARMNTLDPSWNQRSVLSVFYLPQLSQFDFDHLLWASDVNFVRGEDSLVRALWAGKPLVWHIYPQHDGVHAHKLATFLDWLQAPASLRAFHRRWNGLDAPGPGLPDAAFEPERWQDCMAQARAKLLDQADLSTQLLNFIAKIP